MQNSTKKCYFKTYGQLTILPQGMEYYTHSKQIRLHTQLLYYYEKEQIRFVQFLLLYYWLMITISTYNQAITLYPHI